MSFAYGYEGNLNFFKYVTNYKWSDVGDKVSISIFPSTVV